MALPAFSPMKMHGKQSLRESPDAPIRCIAVPDAALLRQGQILLVFLPIKGYFIYAK
jgi:hypothetical protein